MGGPAHPSDRQVVLRYLVAVGLIDSSANLDPQIIVFDYSRSHRVWLVQLNDGRRLFVKRARPQFADAQVGLGAESLIYQLAADLPNLREVLPTCLWIDQRQHILVLEAVKPGENLHVHHYTQGPSVEYARQLGVMLAICHQASTDLPLEGLPEVNVWILNSLVPDGWRPWFADQVLAQVPLRNALTTQFAVLKETLNADCLTHGDMKWGNCLIGMNGIKTIDWELAGIGDAAWDLAGLLHEYIALTCVQPTSSEVKAVLKSCVETIIGTYLQYASPAAAEAFLTRSAQLTGARLIQCAFEHAAATPDASYIQILVERGLEVMQTPKHLLEGKVFQ